MGRIHPEAERIHFSIRPQDRKVVRPFLLGFDVTKAIRWSKGPDSIIAFYLKAERTMAEFLGLERELLMVYSPFRDFQARSIELHDALVATERLRLDPLGSVLVSDASRVREAVQEYLATDPERAPIVALSTRELEAINDLNQLKAAFIEQYFRRDLFALESPLRHDTLFFGRNEILARLVDRFRSGQNSGLFGLRRMGKTSVLYALGRRCNEDELGGFTYVDLSNPGMYGLRWRDLLRAIVRSVVESIPSERRPYGVRAMRYSYSEENAASHFKNDIALVRSVIPKRRLLLALDEIENITFGGISPADHWATDFLPFWQTMRSVHQESQGDFCFTLVGVNPHSMEVDRVGKFDNPLFSTVQYHYLPPFSPGAVRDMVRRLARSMGIQCEEDLYGRLAREYGGHPFLIRQACSHLVADLNQRPAKLTVEHFERERQEIALKLEKNVRQILNVLALWYPDEYELLRRLAHGNVEEFIEAARASATLTEHLEGYGLLKDARTAPALSIDLVSNYLARQSGPSDEPPERVDTLEDMLAESSRRRNAIEFRLRSVASLALALKYGEKAAAKALACWPEDRRTKLMQYGYADLWPLLLLSELIAVFDKEWDAYQNWFATEKDQVLTWLRHINEVRADAHAKKIDATDWEYLRVCFKKLEERLDKIDALYPVQPKAN